MILYQNVCVRKLGMFEKKVGNFRKKHEERPSVKASGQI